jgi:hypothetical protein
MKFNLHTRRVHLTANHEGETAYTLSSQLELYTAVVTTSLSNSFYEKDSKRIERLRQLIAQNDPEFVAKLAIYAREQMHLRSVPSVLAVELAKIHNGNNLVSRLVARMVQRADEITELLAYYQLANSRNGIKKLGLLSKQVQKGLALAFNKFDEYQFAKYNRDAEVKLKDALFLVHPKAKSVDQQDLFNKIVTGSLKVPYTWETELSAFGQQTFENEQAKATAFRAKWEELIDSGKLGYMALLRNLRNLLQANVSKAHISKVATRLGDAHAVANSKQLPFRFLSAYREIKTVNSFHASEILNALEKAMLVSAANIKGFSADTKVLIACDTSGSMCAPVSPKSSVQLYDIGLVLGMLLQNRCHSVQSGMFGDTWKIINLPQTNILANADELRRRAGEVGYSTNGYLVIKDLVARKQIVDKVMIFTDCQLWNSNGTGETIAHYWKQYKAIAPDARIYLFDLAGYGQAPLRTEGKDVFLLAGWSDKVFEVLEAIENGDNALTQIEKVAL